MNFADPFDYFPRRDAADRLDVAGLVQRMLMSPDERLVLEFSGEAWTNRRLARRVAWLQDWLRAKGLQQGDRLAIMAGNSPDHVALIYAAILSGIIWLPVNTKLKAAGLQYLVDHAKPSLAVVTGAFAAEWAKALETMSHQCVTADSPEQGEATMAPELRVIAPLDTLCLIYTSGTTGAPKGVVFTHRMLRAAAEAALLVGDIHDGDRLFHWEPLCHVGGAQMLVVPALVDVTLQMVESFSASRFWTQIDQAKSSHLHYLGGIIDILIQIPRAEGLAPSLRVAWGGGGMNANNWQQARERIAPEVRECYGMTETSSFATINATGKPGSVGKPLPWVTLELLDDASAPVPLGVHGEIVLSSAVEGVFLSQYLDNPEATSLALRGGKLYTGDFAYQDADGDLFFVGRKTDSMRVRGENVSAWEVERVLASHPEVLAVAAVGVKSDVGEQEILAYVQWRGATGDVRALWGWTKERLARFQVPRFWATVPRFELTPSERIRKHLLPRDTSAAWDSTVA